MKIRELVCIAVVSLTAGFSALSSFAQPGDGTPALSLPDVINEALSNNPSLKAASENWQAMQARIPQARAWDDPRLGFDTRAARFIGVPPNSFMDQKLMAEQKLPLSGQNRLRGDAATADAAAALQEFRRKQLNVVSRVRVAFFNLANARKQLELNRKNSALLRQYVEISRAKLATGDSSQADVLDAETDLAKLDEAQFDFQREISEAQTGLNVLMNRSPETPLAAPGEMSFAPAPLYLPDLEALALANRPELIIAQRKLEAAQSRLRAARQERIPDPSVRVEGDRYNGASQVVSELDVGFSIDLPWFNRKKYRAAIDENEKLVDAAQHELEALRSETLGAVVDQFHIVETFHHHTELYHTKLLPLARESTDAQRTLYESSRGSFLETLTAQQTARDVESMYWDHLAHYQIALAELESLIGVELPVSNQTNALNAPAAK